MESSSGLTASSRVKACTECRQHKIRCDAAKNNGVPCSRCRRRGLTCEIAATFRRTKRRTKKELQAEVESLRQQVAEDQPRQAPHQGVKVSPGVTSGLGIPSSILPEDTTNTYPALTPASIPYSSISQDPETLGHLQVPGDPLDSDISSTVNTTVQRSLGGIEVSSNAIESCFNLFHEKYLPHVPIFEGRLHPNACFAQCELLFWAIVAVGARKFSDDPTLLTSLLSPVADLSSNAVLLREKPLPTIQALILLCAWPLPHDSLSKDISPMLAGTLLQLALTIGLHVYGIGQDFSRTKLKADRVQIQHRSRLWYLCVTTCQRVSITTGIPPPVVPDTYSREHSGGSAENVLPRQVVFEKQLSAVHTEGIVQLERHGLATRPDQRASVLNPLIDSITDNLRTFETLCQDDIGVFYLLAAKLQVACFHFFVPQDAIEPGRLYQIYELACSSIETAQRIEERQSWAKDAPIFIAKYLELSAFTILKITRCYLSQELDVERGKQAYFFVINFARDSSVQAGDVATRLVGILTQLWASKNIFRNADGTFDSLSLRCGSRLAMSVVFDSFWRWRSEFAGMQNPYDETDSKQKGEMGSAQRSRQPTPPASTSTPFDDLSVFDLSFPESQFATAQDLLSLDWSQYQGDLLYFDNMNANPGLFGGNELWNTMPSINNPNFVRPEGMTAAPI